MLRHSHKGHITSPLPFCSCCNDTLNRCQICLVIPCLCAFGNTSKYFLVWRGSAAKVSYFSFFEKGICLCVLSVIAKILKFFIMCLVFSSGEENDFNLQWIKVDSTDVLVSSPPKMLFSFHLLSKAGCLPRNQLLKQRCFHCVVLMILMHGVLFLFIYLLVCFLVLVLDLSNTKAPWVLFTLRSLFAGWWDHFSTSHLNQNC